MHSRTSIISYCLALVSFTIVFIAKGSAFSSQEIENVGILGFTIGAIVSVVTAILSLLNSESNKIYPTISLTTAFICLYIISLTLLSDQYKSVQVDSGSITNYGIFQIPKRKIDSVKVHKLYELRYLKQNTDSIPASLGLHFGFNYAITGKPDISYVDVSKIIRYPEPGLKRNGKYVHSDSSSVSIRLNEIQYYGFQFEYDYELVPGNWEYEFSYKGTKLFSKSFVVYLPSPIRKK